MRKLCLISILSLFPAIVFAAAGAIDTTFSGDGLKTTRIRTGETSGDSHVTVVAIDSEGRIVTAGYAREGGGDQFALARFTSGGAVDSGFQGGTVITNITDCTHERIQAMVIQSDNKILVGGYCRLATLNKERMVIARYKTDGTLDETFSGGGKEILDPGADEASAHWRINALTLQNGKILVAGYATRKDGTSTTGYLRGSRIALGRILSEGGIDNTFGPTGNGYYLSESRTLFDRDIGAEAHTVAVQPDGKVLAGGSAFLFPVIIRCADADCGSLDTGFGSRGTTGAELTLISQYLGILSDIAIQGNGKIVAVGTVWGGIINSNPTTMDLLTIRYDDNGIPDPTFGTGANGNGLIITPVTERWSIGGGVKIQPADGKIVTTGYAIKNGMSATRDLEFIVRRLDGTNGSPDTTFDTDGMQKVSLGTTNAFGGINDLLVYPLEDLNDAVLQPDGRIVVAGFSRDEVRNLFTVARVWAGDASDLDMTSVTADRERRVKGGQVIFTASHINGAGDLARGVRVTSRFTLPVEFVSANRDGCTTQAEGGGTVIVCPSPDIAVGADANALILTVKVLTAGNLLCTATATSDNLDTDLVNSSKTRSVTITETDAPPDDPGDPDDDPGDPGDPDDPADDPDAPPPPPPEHRERRTFEISDQPGAEEGAGGCSFIPRGSTGPQDFLVTLLGAIPLLLLSLKEILRLLRRGSGQVRSGQVWRKKS